MFEVHIHTGTNLYGGYSIMFIEASDDVEAEDLAWERYFKYLPYDEEHLPMITLIKEKNVL